MKVIVLYNRVESLSFGQPEDILADQDSLKTTQEIISGLKSLGHEVESFEVSPDSLDKLKSLHPDLFFNNAFGIGNLPKTESQVAQLLEKTGLPFTGSSSRAITLTTDKVATKKLLIANNLPTPKYQVFTDSQNLDPNFRFPVVVKPAGEDCSLGITEQSVFAAPSQVREYVDNLKKKYHEPILVEEYIDGRELNVTVLGNRGNVQVLPISEIIFGPSFDNKYKIVDFNAKWNEDSVAFKETTGHCPADLDELTQSVIENISKTAFLLTGCSDLARVDIRLSKTNQPFILEINANPAVGSQDGTVRSAAAANFSYRDFLQKLVELGYGRYHQAQIYLKR